MKQIVTSTSVRNLFVIGLLLGVLSNAFGQGPTFTKVDYPGAASTLAWGVSTRGDIVGSYVGADKLTHGFLLIGGQYSTVDFPGATSTSVFTINPRGDAGGVYVLDGVSHGFVLAGGKFTTIDFPGASASEVGGINPRGEILGDYTLAGARHGFLLIGDKFSTIDFPGAANTTPVSINPQGDIVGSYNLAGVFHGFQLIDGEFTSIDVPGATRTGANAINARGDIAGRYVSADGVSHAFLLSGGQVSTIDFPGATFTAADAMNQRGDIVGRYTINGVTNGYLLAGFRPTCVSPGPPTLISVPSLLSVSGDGRGQGAIQHSNTFQLASASSPAVAGEILSVYFTGLVNGGSIPPQVTIGGLTAELLFFGNTPGYPGLNQVNLRVPVGVAPGAAVPVRLTYLSRTSNEVTISIR